MLKFLRKYNMIILVVGGVILMISFLIPQALQQFGANPSSMVVGHIDGKPIKGKAYMAAKRELEILSRIVPDFVRGRNMSIEHWMLLALEAERNGLAGGATDGRNFVPFIAEEQATSFAMMSAMRGEPIAENEQTALRASLLASINTTIDGLRVGYSEDQVYRALGKFSGVVRLMEVYQGAAPLSTPEAWDFGMQLFDTATADMVVLRGEDLAPDPRSFTSDQLQAHFDEYKDDLPQDNPFNIGYRLNDAVGIELLRLDRSALSEAVVVDPIEVRLHFEALQERGVLAGQTYETVRDQVRQSYIVEQSQQLLDEIVLEVRRELLKSRIKMPVRDGLAQLPADWAQKRPTLESLAAAARAKVPKPELADRVVTLRHDEGELLDATGLSTLPGVNLASFRVNERLSIPFVNYVLGVRELRGGDQRFALQQGLMPVDPMRINGGEDDGDILWVTVLRVREEGPASDWAGMEETLRADLASIEGYRALEARQSEFLAAIGAEGIAAMLEMNMPGATYNYDGKVNRQTVRLADGASAFADANIPAFRDAVMDLLKSWDVELDVATLPLDQRTVATLNPSARTLIIGQVTGRSPMTLEQYTRNASQIAQRARSQAQRTTDAFSFEAISARLKYKPKIDAPADAEATEASAN